MRSLQNSEPNPWGNTVVILVVIILITMLAMMDHVMNKPRVLHDYVYDKEVVASDYKRYSVFAYISGPPHCREYVGVEAVAQFTLSIPSSTRVAMDNMPVLSTECKVIKMVAYPVKDVIKFKGDSDSDGE